MKKILTFLIAAYCSLTLYGQATFDADNPNLRYTGRNNMSNSKSPELIHAGASIHVNFSGTSLKLRVRDGSWGNATYFQCIIDGGNPIVRSLDNTEQEITIATGLSNTTHSLIIIKRTGITEGRLIFKNIILDNGATLSSFGARPSRRIALYGDSVTQGINASNTDGDFEGGDAVENGWDTFGMRMARMQNAECHNNGLSGLAVLDGTGFYNVGNGAIGLETTYDQLNPIQASGWNFNNFDPQLVVMALGINDDGFTDGNEEGAWKNAYKNIINDLRNNRHPNADFILTIPPLGFERTRMEGLVQEIVNEINDPDVHYFNITVTPPSAHSNSASHAAMANQLNNFVNTLDIAWGGGTNPPPSNTEGSIEIENNFSVFNEAGSNNSVSIDSNNPDASNGRFVRLYDTNDELSFSFDVSEAGTYQMDFRARVGQSSGTTSDLADQYELRVDGTVRNFSLVNSTISGLDGDTYWGIVRHSRNLSAGSHTIRIRAKSNWLKADRFDYEQTSSSSVAVTSVSINNCPSSNLEINGTVDLNETVNPSNATDKGVSWSSSNTSVATVSNSGLVTAVAQGTATITVTTNDGNRTSTCSITVNGAPSTGGTEVVVRALGSTGEEQFELRLDGVKVGNTRTATTSFANYTFNVDGEGTLSVYFVNDGNSSGGSDKNLRTDYIDVDGERRQAEDQSDNNGGWNAPESKCGGAASEWLHCGGRIIFGELSSPPPPSGNGTVVVNARGTSGAEQIELLFNDVRVGNVVTLSTSEESYTFDVASGSGNIKVNFINDASGRDVRIDWIQINNGTVIQAEDQATNTGGWNVAESKCGGAQSEWLHCSGFIDFGNRSVRKGNDLLATKVNVYPNPVGGEFFSVAVPGEVGSNVSIEVYNLTGKRVLNAVSEAGSTMQFSTQHLTAGMHILNIRRESDGVILNTVKLSVR